MIPDVDEALEALVRRDADLGSGVDVAFDAPTKDWAGRRNAPTVDVYLYDIREDIRRRERGWINRYEDGVVVQRTLPPKYFRLSYLITAWTQRPEDEHRLLAGLLACFLRNEWLPPDLLPEHAADIAEPVQILVAQPAQDERSYADLWSALGGELKPAIDIGISVPLDTGLTVPVGPPVRAPMSLDFGADAGPLREVRRPRGAEETPTKSTGPRARKSQAGGIRRSRKSS